MKREESIEAAGLPPLDPIKHPLRDEAERAWMNGYARQGILSYSKRPPSPFAQFLQGFVAGRDTLARASLAQPVAPEAGSAEAMRVALLANERDRTLVAMAVAAFDKAVSARSWLTNGRGPYEWDDDRFYAEFGAALEEFRAAIQPLRALGTDMSNCPKADADVAEAKERAGSAIRALPLPAPEATVAGENPWCYVVVDAYMRGWDGEYYKVKAAAEREALAASKQVEVPGGWRVVPLYAHPTPPRAEGVDVTARLAAAERERDEARGLLRVAHKCLQGHLIGLNCRGPVLPEEDAARIDAALRDEGSAHA